MAKPLQEKDFIQDSFSTNPFPFWLWLVLLAILAALLWGGSSWMVGQLNQEVEKSPFLHVTNRQFSLFLWQFPEYMRQNVKQTGYLPGFQNVTILPGEADKYVVAPPETLFLYHSWDRLIAKEYTPRPILAKEFEEFLNASPEWQPNNWPEAPKGYDEFVRKLSDQSGDLQAALPDGVRRAFQGWKNYFKEGSAINDIRPTYEQMAQFLERYPHYARNYWRNILLTKVPNYLKQGEAQPGEMAKDELAPFLKVAFFNYLGVAVLGEAALLRWPSR